MMRKFFFFLLFPLLVACSGKPSGPDAALLASQAAKVYYDQLLHGDYAAFVDGMNMNDTVVPAYREQLITNMKMYLGQQKKEHMGIKEVKALRAVRDSVNNKVDAFLLFCFNDSTKEQVVVPMIEKDGAWIMR